eukprot:6656827-Pyramimonas_sp.AAC.1
MEKNYDVCWLGPAWHSRGGPLGAFRRPRGPSGRHLGRLRSILGLFGAFLSRGGLLRPSWPVLGLSWALQNLRATAPETSGEPRQTPGDLAIWGPSPLTVQPQGPRSDDYKGPDGTPTRASRARWARNGPI